MEKIIAKQCFKCKKNKVISEFYAHPQMADGTLGKCKECTKKDANEHRMANLIKIRAYDRARALLPHRKKLNVEVNKRYRQQFPLRYKANMILGNALRDGKINKSHICSLCKETKKTLGHHDDYSKPLEVVWICQPCHKQIHKDWVESF